MIVDPASKDELIGELAKPGGLTVKEKLTRNITRLAKHLVHFPPESLHLQVVLEKLEKKHSFTVRMTLRLPSSILHAEKAHEHLLAGIDSTAAALEREVQSLKAALRSDYRWKTFHFARFKCCQCLDSRRLKSST